MSGTVCAEYGPPEVDVEMEDELWDGVDPLGLMASQLIKYTVKEGFRTYLKSW